ncbi:MAG: 4'-phosphopantetheinyl transferase family protein [Steroidobacteraceae bacterium]
MAYEARSQIGPDALLEEEAGYVARAVPKRVGEFAAGRACARRALADLRITGFALGVGPDREPLWPPGVTGSITHTRGFCGAAVARHAATAGLGIDAERRDALHRRLWRRIATPGELDWLEGLPPQLALDMASVLFSAKEAFFKCQFPVTREWLNFTDVRVSVERPRLRIWPERHLALGRRAAPPWEGRYALAGALVVAGFSLPPTLQIQ